MTNMKLENMRTTAMPSIEKEVDKEARKRSLLKENFPMIREREEVLEEINKTPKLLDTYRSWDAEEQKEFLDMCTGAHGIRILYDPYFKEIMNPDATPERLEELLSFLLGNKIRILKVLPNESRLTAEGSLLILDIVIELENGSIANVEVQKMGYAFPGERSACYSADLLLRQYQRARSERGKHFKYKDIKKVYTIVFFEKSPKEFQGFPENYIHHSKQNFDTGLELEMLQEYTMIPLDIFKTRHHNKTVRINNRLEAWLTFLSEDDPEKIINLIQTFPDFKKIYEEMYNMCRNLEGIMSMFSKELELMDKNTVMYMIDEMQATIDAQKTHYEEQIIENKKQAEAELAKKDQKIAEKDQALTEKDQALTEKDQALTEKDQALTEKDQLIAELRRQLQEKSQDNQ